MRTPWDWARTPLVLPPAREQPEREPATCLVHLVRAANGLGSLREFAQALRRHPPGIEYELVFAMKGFTSLEEVEPYLQEIADLPHDTLFFPDRGFDLGVYFATAARLRRTSYCFVNSHGRPVADGWLAKLKAALDRPGVGQVGATGSWASSHSWVMYSMGLPSAYRGLMPPLAVAREQLMGIQLERLAVERPTMAHSLRVRARALLRLPEDIWGYGPFPTPHLRPNTFMITHEVLRRLRLFVVRSKLDTYALESGRESITSQLERIGLSSLVVDNTGATYTPETWDRSQTFWQGDQRGLLVADNQTLCYARGDAIRRKVLSAVAWGPNSDPAYSPQTDGQAAANGRNG